MNLMKEGDKDFVTYAGIINKACERFKLNETTPDMFKWLIFVQRLMAKKNIKICAQILRKIEQNQKLTQEILDECQRILNLRHDMEESGGKKCTYIHTS